MQLNSTTDYAVRILVYLGITERVTPSGEIAEEMVIPANYVPNIIKKLRDQGLVSATYGPRGGYALQVDAKDIKIVDVINTMEGAIMVNRCAIKEGACSRDAAIHAAMYEAYQDIQEKIEAAFSSKTIGDLVASSKSAK